MPDKDSQKTPDYETGSSSTNAETPKISPTFDKDIKLEMEKYGSGKPERVVFRAKVTHDENK